MQYVETKDRLSISSIYYIGKLSTPLNGNDTPYANTSQNDGAIDGLNQTWVDSNGLPHTPHTSHQGGRGCHWELQQLYIDHLLIQKHHYLFEQCWEPDALIWNKVIYDFVFIYDFIFYQRWSISSWRLDWKCPPPWHFSENSSNLVAGPFPKVTLHHLLFPLERFSSQ